MKYADNKLTGKNIAIVGAGIIGACCAAELSGLGAKVTILDRAMPGMAGASRGNAAHIAAPAIFPLAAPGIILNALSMLVSAKAQFNVPISQWPKLMPWLVKFMLNANEKTYQKNTDKTGRFNQNVLSDTKHLYQVAGLSDQLNNHGALYLYESQSSFEKSKGAFATMGDFGFDSETLTAKQIYELEPELAKSFSGGHLIPQWLTVRDPKKIVTGLIDYCCKHGGQFQCEEITGLSHHQNGVLLAYKNGNLASFDRVILAAGIDSKPLLKTLGQKTLLTSERGYNLTYTRAGFAINRSIIFADRGVVATQLDQGLRFGGWAELVCDDIPVNEAYFDTINEIARELFPALQTEDNYLWMGARPSTPDSQPVIAACKDNPNIIYAFGHGHLGLTQGPTTAKLVAQLLI